MKFTLLDKHKKQKAEILIESFKENVVIGTIVSYSFDEELIAKITDFEELVDSYHFGELLDEAAILLDAYDWQAQGKGWIIFNFQVFDRKHISFRIKDINEHLGGKDVANRLQELGYDNRWLLYKYITLEEINTQYVLYKKAVKNPESIEAENGYQHTEHVRYSQFYKIVKTHKKFTNQQLEELIELVACDEDQVMAKNLYDEILNKKMLTLEQLEKYKEIKN